VAEASDQSQATQLDRQELRLALQRLASGYYDRPDVLRVVARRILQLEEKNRP
jgi:hypothetical protein